VGDAVDVEPDVAADFSFVGFVVNAIVEDFGSAAWEAAEAGFLELAEDEANGFAAGGAAFFAWCACAFVDFGDLAEVDDFNGGEGFDVEVAAHLLGFITEGGDEVGVVAEGERGVEAADGVDFGCAAFDGFAGLLADIGHVARVGFFFAGFGEEVAEFAREGADVGIVEVAVDVVVGVGAVEATADAVGEFDDGPDVGGGEEEVAIGEGEALAACNFVGDGVEAWVAAGEGGADGGGGCGGHGK